MTLDLLRSLAKLNQLFNAAEWRGCPVDTVRCVGPRIYQGEDGRHVLDVTFITDSPYRSIGTTRGVERQVFRIAGSVDFAAAFPENEWEEVKPETSESVT